MMITTINMKIEIANMASERLYLGFVEFGLSLWPIIYLNSRKVTIGIILRFIKYFLKFTSKEMHYFYHFSYHPLINPIVNPADILLPVNGIPKLLIANEEAAAAWTSPTLLLLLEYLQRSHHQL